MHKVYLGLGTNIGDKQRNIQQAVAQIGLLIGSVVRQSSLYETAPWGFQSPNSFLNGAVQADTLLSPKEVLDVTQHIEHRIGRREKSQNGIYKDRLIDIDILLYDDLYINEPTLKIPHPLMWEREFVMKPLREICPEHILLQCKR